MKKLKLIVLLICFTASSFASEDKLFGGGMFIETGYWKVSTLYGDASGSPLGIGGKLHFQLSKHYRIGMMGAKTTLNYINIGLEGSYLQLGYGGLTGEAVYEKGDVIITGGFLFGGASINNLHLLNKTVPESVYSAQINHYTSLIFSPIVSVEYAATEKISLTLICDYLMGDKIAEDTKLGPKFRFGVIFAS
ncbi:MAG: hypothetical protein C0594_14935 [Marinilabiliales bacterium]|nr:MAG: hypothetical protein C0594_14935 [Marinilabiliales bacterium]